MPTNDGSINSYYANQRIPSRPPVSASVSDLQTSSVRPPSQSQPSATTTPPSLVPTCSKSKGGCGTVDLFTWQDSTKIDRSKLKLAAEPASEHSGSDPHRCRGCGMPNTLVWEAPKSGQSISEEPSLISRSTSSTVKGR